MLEFNIMLTNNTAEVFKDISTMVMLDFNDNYNYCSILVLILPGAVPIMTVVLMFMS